MPLTSPTRRRAATGLVGALLASALGALTAPAPASASPYYGQATRVMQVVTDSLDVDATDTIGYNARVGTWRDDAGKHHMSRLYATFDVGDFAGRHILAANLFSSESSANDCPSRQIEVWQVADTDKPTWAAPPAEQSLLASFGPGTSCLKTLRVDLLPLVDQAIAEHKPRIAVELRVAADVEGNLAYGRTLRDAQLSIQYNSPPQTPTELYNANQDCGDQADPTFVTRQPALSARFRDADGDPMTGTFAVWPVDHPDQRAEYTRDWLSNGWVGGLQVPTALDDATTYAWQVRATDGTDTTDWSKTCYITTDGVRPGTPGIAVSNYPQNTWNPGGVPVHVTFSANGTADVAYYQYSWQPYLSAICSSEIGEYGTPRYQSPEGTPGVVAPDRLGGPVTLDLSPPTSGPVTLYVRAVDRACNVSYDTASYDFLVADTSPTVRADHNPTLNEPVTLTFTPNPAVPDVTSYTYQVNYGDKQTIAPGADGSASITLTPDHYGSYSVQVRSVSSNGWISPEANWWAEVSNAPQVSSDVYPDWYATGTAGGGVGVPGEFTFTSHQEGVVAFVYYVDWNEQLTVPAGPDGTATVTVTPDYGGYHEIAVWGVDANGFWISDMGWYAFNVNDTGSAQL